MSNEHGRISQMHMSSKRSQTRLMAFMWHSGKGIIIETENRSLVPGAQAGVGVGGALNHKGAGQGNLAGGDRIVP